MKNLDNLGSALANFAEDANKIFDEATAKYHLQDDVEGDYGCVVDGCPCNNASTPAFVNNNEVQNGGNEADVMGEMLYRKNIIDAVQWHLEDIVRDPEIDPVKALGIKRRIDRLNQQRTDLVEQIDSWFRNKFADVVVNDDATINTESPAWAIDRLSILALKIWHMREQAERPDANEAHKEQCRVKLEILLEQRKDLTSAIDTLLLDMAMGRKYMKVYRQMKMYNDPSTNPVLYGAQNKK